MHDQLTHIHIFNLFAFQQQNINILSTLCYSLFIRYLRQNETFRIGAVEISKILLHRSFQTVRETPEQMKIQGFKEWGKSFTFSGFLFTEFCLFLYNSLEFY